MPKTRSWVCPEAAAATPAADGEKPGGAKARLTENVESSKHTLDQWQHQIDERIRAILPGVGLFRELQAEVKRLTQRVDELEAHLHAPGTKAPPRTDIGPAGGAARGESIKKE